MKKRLVYLMVLAVSAVVFSICPQEKVTAGPFGKAGKWVDGSNGSKVCIAHWWLNDCAVGSRDDGGPQE